MAKRILIVDDERDFVTIMTTVLQQAGYECDTARNGREAIGAYIESMYSKKLLSLILLDISMPGLNGLEVLELLRKEEKLRKDLASIIAASKTAPVWIAWPKRGSTIKSDLWQQSVRKIAMAEGMVDYKVCSIDADWSALLFTWRGKSA